MRVLIRLYLAALLILAAATASAAAAEHHVIGLTSSRDSWTTQDKAEHLGVGFVAGAFGALMADEIMPAEAPTWKKVCVGIALSALLGTAKEVSDYRHPGQHDCSLKDFSATAIGGVLGSVSVGLVIRF